MTKRFQLDGYKNQIKQSAIRVCFFSSLFMFVILIAACNVQPISADKILDNILHSDHDTISYYLETEMTLLDETMIMKEWHSSSGKTRTEIVDKKTGELENIMIMDGEKMWMISPSLNEVTYFDLDDQSYRELVETSPRDQVIQMIETLDTSVKHVNDETILGRDTFELEIAQEVIGNEVTMRIWVDVDTWIILQTEVDFGAEKVVSQAIAFELNPVMDDDLFVFHPTEEMTMRSIDDFESSIHNVTLDEAKDLLGQSFFMPKETESMTIDEITAYAMQFLEHNDEEDYSISLDYVKDDEMYFTLSISQFNEQYEEFMNTDDGPTQSLLGSQETQIVGDREVKIFWNEWIQYISWEENGLIYDFNVYDEELTLDKAILLIEEMKLYHYDY